MGSDHPRSPLKLCAYRLTAIAVTRAITIRSSALCGRVSPWGAALI